MVQVLESLDKNQIKQLKRYLKEHYDQMDELDSYVKEVSMYYEAELPPYYVGTEQDQVTGLLILDEVEDDIAYGRIFTDNSEFLQEIDQIFTENEVSSLVLGTPKELPATSNLKFEYAEYMMTLMPKTGVKTLECPGQGLSLQGKSISLIPVTAQDRMFYETILGMQYDMSKEEAKERFDSLLEEEEMHGFLVYTDNKKRVGVGSYYEGSGFITLFDLTILPEYQGLGYGKAMLLNLVSNNLSKGKKYLLQVTSSNTPAFRLYQKAGFQITEQQLFYAIGNFFEIPIA